MCLLRVNKMVAGRICVSLFSEFIFNHIYEQLSRDNETVRDRFFRVLWIATLVWKLSEFPLPDHVAQLDRMLQEAKQTNPDGTPKKKKQSSSEKIKKSKK